MTKRKCYSKVAQIKSPSLNVPSDLLAAVIDQINDLDDKAMRQVGLRSPPRPSRSPTASWSIMNQVNILLVFECMIINFPESRILSIVKCLHLNPPKLLSLNIAPRRLYYPLCCVKQYLFVTTTSLMTFAWTPGPVITISGQYNTIIYDRPRGQRR